MGISRHLAMTAAEMEAVSLPEHWNVAYMACHFSPYTTGLSNVPDALPPGSMLILNDRTPICGHDPERIAQQLQQALDVLQFNSVLLDFQRPLQEEIPPLCRHLIASLPCPVGISDLYAEDLDCPVFLPPVQPDQPLREHIAPWQTREIWLDVAPDAICYCVTPTGSTYSPCPIPEATENVFSDAALHCRYRMEIKEEEVFFHIWRDTAQLEQLIEAAQALGITKCIGLYQEFSHK